MSGKTQIDRIFDNMGYKEVVRVPVIAKRSGLTNQQVSTALVQLQREGSLEQLVSQDPNDPYYSYRKIRKSRPSKKLRKTAMRAAMDDAKQKQEQENQTIDPSPPKNEVEPLSIKPATPVPKKEYSMEDLDEAINGLLNSATHVIEVAQHMREDLKEKNEVLERLREVMERK